jgi:hypothetical protein
MELLYHYFVETWVALVTFITHPSSETLAQYVGVVRDYHLGTWSIAGLVLLFLYALRPMSEPTPTAERNIFYYIVFSPVVLAWSVFLYSLLHVVLSIVTRTTWFLFVDMWAYPYAWSVIAAVALFVLITVIWCVRIFRVRTR